MTLTGVECQQVAHPDDLARTAMEVSHLHGFLAAVFREEVSPGFLRRLRSPEVRKALTAVGVPLDTEFLTADEALLLERLAVEYAALFLGPGDHISPHESVHVEGGSGRLWGDETVGARSYIEAAGFRYQAHYRGIPDHISVELDFMSEVARRESEAWAAWDPAAAGNCLEYEQEFMDDHLSVWVPRFCAKVVEAGDMSFYRDMAQLTAAFMAGEAEDIQRRAAAAEV